MASQYKDLRQVSAIVLAAGQSQRFKSCKMEAQFNISSPSVLDLSLRSLGEDFFAEIILVGQANTKFTYQSPKVKMLVNTKPEKGVGYSLGLAVPHLMERSSEVAIFLGDMPFVDMTECQLMLDELIRRRLDFIRPLNIPELGHPVIAKRSSLEKLFVNQGENLNIKSAFLDPEYRSFYYESLKAGNYFDVDYRSSSMRDFLGSL